MYSTIPIFNAIHKKKSPFITKLAEILSKPEYSDIISWDVSGDNILIHHIVRFELEVLPIYFDSSRMDSFSRQLNLYGFKRVSDGRKQRSGPLDRGCMFNCPFFKRDRPDLCHLISRKKKGQTKTKFTETITKKKMEPNSKSSPKLKPKPIIIPNNDQFNQSFSFSTTATQFYHDPLQVCYTTSQLSKPFYPYSTFLTPVTYTNDFYSAAYENCFIGDGAMTTYPFMIDSHSSMNQIDSACSSNLSSPGLCAYFDTTSQPQYYQEAFATSLGQPNV